MNERRALAARLLGEESEIESLPLDEIEANLGALGIDPTDAITHARARATERSSPAALLLDRATESETADRSASRIGSDDDQREHWNGWASPAGILGLLRAADTATILVAATAAWITRFHGGYKSLEIEGYAGVLAILLALHIFEAAGLYRFERLTDLLGQLGRLVLAWTAVMLILLALGFMTKELGSTSRIWVGLWYVYGLFGLFTVRLLLKQQILSWRREGLLTRSVVIVGAGEHGQRLIEHMCRVGSEGDHVVGVFDDSYSPSAGPVGGVPFCGDIDDLRDFARKNPIDQIIVALDPGEATRRLAWMEKLRGLPVDVLVCPDVIGIDLPQRQMTHVAGVPMLHVVEKPLAGWRYAIKSVEDRVLATAILLLISPMMMLIASLIKLDSRGPVLVRQRRYGFDGEPIDVFRFRTCDRDGEVITTVGRILHRHSLDELPQFINVVFGSMSIVGPRPRRAAPIDQAVAWHRIKPGITGWAQVNGLWGEGATLDHFDQRARFDRYYIENWSLSFDLRIILQTLSVSFRRRSAV